MLADCEEESWKRVRKRTRFDPPLNHPVRLHMDFHRLGHLAPKQRDHPRDCQRSQVDKNGEVPREEDVESCKVKPRSNIVLCVPKPAEDEVMSESRETADKQREMREREYGRKRIDGARWGS